MLLVLGIKSSLKLLTCSLFKQLTLQTLQKQIVPLPNKIKVEVRNIIGPSI